MTKELLEKYLNNSCTAQEVEQIILWMKEKSFHSESREFTRKDWLQFRNENSLVTDQNLDTLLDKIHHRINNEEVYLIHQKKNKFYDWTLKAAAILLIPVLVFMSYSITENKKLTNQLKIVSVDSLEVISPAGSRTVAELSDGTVVHLNYGSRIKYPQNFVGKIRGALLTGEGYFEVIHNPDKPFVVNAGGLKVKAVGTSFNVNAYAENNTVATTLVEGKVILEKQASDNNFVKLCEMRPNQHITYDSKTNKIISRNGNIDKFIAWKDGKLVFDNEKNDLSSQRVKE